MADPPPPQNVTYYTSNEKDFVLKLHRYIFIIRIHLIMMVWDMVQMMTVIWNFRFLQFEPTSCEFGVSHAASNVFSESVHTS